MKKVIVKGDSAEVVDATVGDFFSTIFDGNQDLTGTPSLVQKALLMLLGACVESKYATDSWNPLSGRK